jgi:hypothetical protein
LSRPEVTAGHRATNQEEKVGCEVRESQGQIGMYLHRTHELKQNPCMLLTVLVHLGFCNKIP